MRPGTRRKKQRKRQNGILDCAPLIYLGELKHPFQVYMLRVRNKQYGTVKFFDISFDDYSPEEDQGLDYKTEYLLQFF
ncbi:uncharacterized protein CFP56_007776 [Quercus suber]|uniref:Uncharacterized protein n=1 Tax=Quercus suber TaxID=58331 RepID=A0AAW0M602_QUESU